MDSASETVVVPTEPSQNGDSHLETKNGPEVNITDTTSPSTEQISEMAPKIAEDIAKKSEPKPLKTNKKPKDEEKKLRSLLKSLEEEENPENKLDALARKYIQLASEHKTTQAKKDELEKRLGKVGKERDHLQSEFNKASLAKHKLESLCRELQRHSKLVKEQSQLRSQEEEAKRKELSEKFQTTINDISEQMQENYKANQQLKNENNDLAARLKVLAEQYEVREEHVEKVFKHKQLEVQLAEAKLAQQNLQFEEDKRKTLAENQLLIKQAQEYQKQCEILTKQEAEMKSQLTLYAERFEDFQKTLNKSNEVFSTFKKEMDTMTKTIKKLEKERNIWKSKFDGVNRSLVQMVEEGEKRKSEMSVLRVKNERLEKLCRALHKGGKVTANDVEQEKSQCPFTAENGVDENSAQNVDAEAEKANCNTGEEPAKEREVWSEDKPDSVEVTADSASNESSQTDRDSVAEEPTDSKDSSKNTETSETVPSDSPSGPVEVPIESEKADEGVNASDESENQDEVPNESGIPDEISNNSETADEVPNESVKPGEISIKCGIPDQVPNESGKLVEAPNDSEILGEFPVASEIPVKVSSESRIPDEVSNESETPVEVPIESKTLSEIPNGSNNELEVK
ncbi:PREDICTED: alpha-taxilin-like isoform X2 [Acropora digitifera]|uniref:alpha-taxilin-like isoform X2 n=1 Tax=Acropora digitifera TaxID=70779 RepID=UPI00077AB641|nr:PREDICTED: alpha-taxilin-like isoform X2 [Acropora digitifera]